MIKDKYLWIWLCPLVLFCITLVVVNIKFSTSGYFHFSDAAKFADIARNIYQGDGFGSDFSFFSKSLLPVLKSDAFPAAGISVFTPYVINLAYYIIGIGDLAVKAVSAAFYLGILLFTFLLSRKVFKNNLTALFSTLVVGSNRDLINYASSGASESPFIFEIVSALYFLSLRKKWATLFGLVILGIMYLTRPQAFIYILGAILFWLIQNFKTNKAFIVFVAISAFALIVDKFIISNIPDNIFLISLFDRGRNSMVNNLPGSSVSDVLRGGLTTTSTFAVAKKVFYNLYNFYKLLPQIINPYLFVLFIIGILPYSLKTSKGQTKTLNAFKTASLFMVAVTLTVTAASIPFFRYIHPVIPLVYIIAVGTLVQIINLQFSIRQNRSVDNQFKIFNFKISKQTTINVITLILVLFFGVGQTLGILFLDSRFERNTHNTDKPPVYVVLSQKLKDNTNPTDVVITNLDTWGSWYGDRKTVWFPLEPKQLVDPSTGEIPFDAIYLTGYLIDDENYYMNASWRSIFDNPKNPNKWDCEGCDLIAEKFTLKGVYEVASEENYERMTTNAVLLIKK